MSWVQNTIRWLLPDEGPFYGLIGDAGEAAHKGAELLQELIKVHGDAPRIVLIERIRDSEHEGDRALQSMADALDRTFVTPLDREDLWALTAALEGVSDLVNSTANHLTVHRMGDLPEGTAEIAAVLVKATGILREAAHLVSDRTAADRIRQMCRDVHYLEHESDVIYRTRVGDLFTHEKDAIQLIKHKEFLEGLENAVDRCSNAARVLEGIVLKHG
jgi:uncharacterized protein Yka (UPF0111/DUF47 family)